MNNGHSPPRTANRVILGSGFDGRVDCLFISRSAGREASSSPMRMPNEFLLKRSTNTTISHEKEQT